MIYRPAILTAVVVALALITAPTALADTAKLTVVQPSQSEKQTHKTYGEWSALWWQTMLKIPATGNPTFDTNGANCAKGETASMFFLAGDFSGAGVTRNCTVPSNKPLFFPIINADCSNVESPPFYGKTPNDRKACVNGVINGVQVSSVKVKLDEDNLDDLGGFRVASEDFHFTMPPTDNILGVMSGASSGNAVSDGYWMLLKPPTPGRHTIHFEASIPAAHFAQDVTYNLTVQCTHDSHGCSNTG